MAKKMMTKEDMKYYLLRVEEAKALMERNEEAETWEDLSEQDLDRINYLANSVFEQMFEAFKEAPDEFYQAKKEIKSFLEWNASLGA